MIRGPLFLDQIDAAPQDDDFSYTFKAWVANTIDTLNEVIIDVQNQLNGLSFPVMPPTVTQAELLATYANFRDSAIWYVADSSIPFYGLVAKINGSLVSLNTTAFP